VKRIREGAALPMEAVQSLRALDSARMDYLQTLTAYNKAQYRLFTATGNAAMDAETTDSK
jgi:outer membrane protein TolC